jgi:ComF family protein
MIRYLLNFIFPPRCAGCFARFPISETRRVCAVCLAGVERLREPWCAICGIPLDPTLDAPAERLCLVCREAPPHFTAARAITRYRASDQDRATVPSLIRRHKYGRDQSLAHALAECLGDSLPLGDDDYDLVVPVPLHHARLTWRGFNQAALLGAAVARRLDRALDTATLIRTRATPSQTAQDRRARHRNVHRAFAVSRPARVANRRILLIDDDVMTTGATADECARALLQAGARRVDVLALARVL